MYRLFAEKYHWPADVVNELSFPQIMMYLNDNKKTIKFGSMAEARAYMEQQKNG